MSNKQKPETHICYVCGKNNRAGRSFRVRKDQEKNRVVDSSELYYYREKEENEMIEIIGEPREATEEELQEMGYEQKDRKNRNGSRR